MKLEHGVHRFKGSYEELTNWLNGAEEEGWSPTILCTKSFNDDQIDCVIHHTRRKKDQE